MIWFGVNRGLSIRHLFGYCKKADRFFGLDFSPRAGGKPAGRFYA